MHYDVAVNICNVSALLVLGTVVVSVEVVPFQETSNSSTVLASLNFDALFAAS